MWIPWFLYVVTGNSNCLCFKSETISIKAWRFQSCFSWIYKFIHGVWNSAIWFQLSIYRNGWFYHIFFKFAPFWFRWVLYFWRSFCLWFLQYARKRIIRSEPAYLYRCANTARPPKRWICCFLQSCRQTLTCTWYKINFYWRQGILLIQ